MTDADPWARVVVVGPDQTSLAMLLGGPGRPDLAVVEGLAWLQLTVRRAGGRMGLEDVCGALAELLDLTGLRREVGG